MIQLLQRFYDLDSGKVSGSPFCIESIALATNTEPIAVTFKFLAAQGFSTCIYNVNLYLSLADFSWWK